MQVGMFGQAAGQTLVPNQNIYYGAIELVCGGSPKVRFLRGKPGTE